MAGKAVQEDIFEVGEEGLSVQDLANLLAVKPGSIVKSLFGRGIMVQVNQVRCFLSCPSLSLSAWKIPRIRLVYVTYVKHLTEIEAESAWLPRIALLVRHRVHKSWPHVKG